MTLYILLVCHITISYKIVIDSFISTRTQINKILYIIIINKMPQVPLLSSLKQASRLIDDDQKLRYIDSIHISGLNSQQTHGLILNLSRLQSSNFKNMLISLSKQHQQYLQRKKQSEYKTNIEREKFQYEKSKQNKRFLFERQNEKKKRVVQIIKSLLILFAAIGAVCLYNIHGLNNHIAPQNGKIQQVPFNPVTLVLRLIGWGVVTVFLMMTLSIIGALVYEPRIQ